MQEHSDVFSDVLEGGKKHRCALYNQGNKRSMSMEYTPFSHTSTPYVVHGFIKGLIRSMRIRVLVGPRLKFAGLGTSRG